jgi:hypothetical protein
MFTLETVVPWGRSCEEYERMFALSAADLRRRIVGCADGPAAFNAVMTRRGSEVVSVDPIYRWSAHEIASRIADTRETVLEQTRSNASGFRWERIPTVEALGEERGLAMDLFLADYESGRARGRYVDAALPDLPFPDDSFDLALCSHFLFLYSDHHDLEFHESALIELCRLAPEVRVFPLLSLDGQVSSFVEPVTRFCRDRGWSASFERVPYEFQRGGHTMMRIRTVGGDAGASGR